MVDYLIVGQGLAGTWLSYFLMEKGQKVVVVDDGHELAASRVSSGLMNPITGRRLVKSWRTEELFPFAKKWYSTLEVKLGSRFCFDRTIVWLLSNVKEINNFWVKSGEEGYEKYFKKIEQEQFHGAFRAKAGFAEIGGAMFVDTANLIENYRQFLKEKQAIVEAKFMHGDLILEGDSVRWKGISARNIVFCEGHLARFNPCFSWLPFVPAKGEFLILEVKDLGLEERGQIVKNKISLVPLGANRYWMGSTYVWDKIDESPTESGQNQLVEQLENTIRVPYKVLAHQAGIRPSAKDRRPFLGIHPECSNVGIFNGLGTKGVSLSPYFAHQLAEFLVDGKALEEVVDIQRYGHLIKN